MKRLTALLLALFLGSVAHTRTVYAADSAASVDIVLGEKATGPEKTAGRELAHFLSKLYAKTQFQITQQPASSAKSIHIGTPRSAPRLLEYLDGKTLQGPESYVVTMATIDGRPAGLIVGADPAGVVNGVYALLRQLGCGFYLSCDTTPAAKDGPFDFKQWDLADRPLAFDRIVFNWHNFLSGCSSWHLDHWQNWIAQSQKAGYNAVMVHAYGNNPMAGFEFNDMQKPVGYLSSTRVGRDWSTMHVNDARRLWGGEVFSQSVFGSSASVAGDDRTRTEAARKLMGKVFQHAEDRGVKVYFAVDIDTVSANPQPLIRSLPESARFAISTKGVSGADRKSEKMWLANPDTPEGYRYYKAQVAALLEHYPGIDCLVAWFRRSTTPWMAIKLEELPADWQKQFAAEVEKTPAARDLWRSHNFFAVARIVAAYQRALKELGREDMETGIGSWQHAFFPAADRFMPAGVKFLPLDQFQVSGFRTRLRGTSSLETPQLRAEVAAAGAHRPVAVIRYAHNDDGHYLGRPYLPNETFATKLNKARSSGFGIIHWTTRPLDIYFDSLARQTRHSTRDESLEETCRDMAARCFGPTAAATMGRYLHKWITEAPSFSRETSDYFFYPRHEVVDPAELAPKMKRRLALLDSVDAAKLTDAQRHRLDYFKGLERYILDSHRAETFYRRAKRELSAGREDEARRLIALSHPEAVIEQFVRFSRLGGITRGDQGTVVSMNTRWLPYVIRLRQQLGLETIRINFGPTSHDPLAQWPGRYTFHFGPRRDMWQTLGEKETGVATFTLPHDADVTLAEESAKGESFESWSEIARSGVESDRPITFALRPILDGKSSVPAGDYRLTLLLAEPSATAEGGRVFDVALDVVSSFTRYRIKSTSGNYLRLICRGNSTNAWNSISEIRLKSLRPEASVTASGSVKGHQPGMAVDGNANTRWAVYGQDNWIQFPLQKKVPLEFMDIDWYEGGKRTYHFDAFVSADGEHWKKLDTHKAVEVENVVERIDLTKRSGGRDRLLTLNYPVTLAQRGTVRVTLSPVKGKVLICGALLTPLGNGR